MGGGGVGGGTHLDCPLNPNESCACNRSPYGTSLGRADVLRCQGCPIAETVVPGVVGLSGQAVRYKPF